MENVFYKTKKNNYDKKINGDYFLLAFCKINGFLMIDIAKNEVVQAEIDQGLAKKTRCIDFLTYYEKDRGKGGAKEVKNVLTVVADSKGKIQFSLCRSILEQESVDFDGERGHKKSVNCVKFSNLVGNKGYYICASGGYDRRILLYKVENFHSRLFQVAKDIKIFARLSLPDPISQLDFSPIDSTLLLCCCYRNFTVQIFNCDDQIGLDKQGKRMVGNIRGSSGFITSAIFSSWERGHVITASEDQTAKIWDISRLKHRCYSQFEGEGQLKGSLENAKEEVLRLASIV